MLRLFSRFFTLATALLLAPLGCKKEVVQGEDIKVGVLHSLTGTMAISEKSVVDAVNLAIEEINGAGGIQGRKVRAVIADGRSDWGVFATEAERLISSEKVAAV